LQAIILSALADHGVDDDVVIVVGPDRTPGENVGLLRLSATTAQAEIDFPDDLHRARTEVFPAVAGSELAASRG
jgi:hypothetical protein